MESGNGGASSKGVLVPVSASSDVFQNSILAPLKSAYLYEESKQSFRYKSAVFIKNPALEEKYNAFRAKRREVGYSEEDLKESYGFLLFDDVNKANALGETGVLTGNSTCTTLGDPSHGVYISMYSDCLDLNRWYHGKSGYIAIIRLTKGRVKKVLENYTQNFTAPTEGFDCHVSEQLPSVSANTSSFLAFERTQYYMYELLDDGSNDTARSPSAACPLAIVSFSYTDTKATLVTPQEKSEEKKLVCHYFPWRGQLQIGTQFYDVGLRSTAGALIPAELPPVVKADRTISMLDLRQLLPRAVFETCFSGEVFLDGLYCSLCELVSSEAEEASSLSLLLWEIKEKDVALTITLKDGGFLILLHSSYFLTYDDNGSSATEVLQGIFVFPDSRVIQRDTKFGQRKSAISSDILRVLPVLTYAEGEVEKTLIDPSEDLCEVLAQHMQSYAALINPGLALSPSREVSIFPDQYDVPDAYKHLYSSPEWTNRAWQSIGSYLSKPLSFQLPVSKVSEILAAGQEERIEDLDDDVYICLSSPEEVPVNHVSMGSEDQLTGQKSPVNVETSVDSCKTSAEAQVDLPAVPQNVVPDDLQAGNGAKDTEKSDVTVLIKTDMGTKNLLTPSTSDDLPAELIVSITSAERTVTSVISTESATKHNDFQLSGFSSAKLQTAGVTSLNDETVKTKKVLDCPEVTNLKTKRRKLRRRYSRGRKKVSETPSLQTVNISVEDDKLKSQREDQAEESSGHPQLSDPSNIDWRKVRRRKRKFGKLSSKNKKVRSETVGLAVAEEKRSRPGQKSLGSSAVCLMELESCPLRKKTERWDLKPVISECGRILVPHGSVDIADQIKSLKVKCQYTKDEHWPEKMLADASVNAHDTVEMEQESSTAPEMAVNKTEATTSEDGGNLLQTVVVSHVNPEHSILRQSDDGNGSLTLNPESSGHSTKNDGADTPSSEAVREKHTGTLSPGKCATKGEILLSKLKSVLLRGKRKTGLLVSGETTADTAQDAEPCLKKGKVDSDTRMLKSNDEITSVQDTSVGVNEVSKTLSVDPLFAYALGLTPKETPDKIQKTEGQDAQQRKDSPETQEQTCLDKQPQIIQRPPSIFPRRGRIKTLKKHQGISAEHVKKKCTPFQVSPLSGSTRLLHHHQTMYGDGIKTLHPSVGREDRSEHNHRTPEYLKKHMVYRRKFRHSRTFVNKDGSIEVTKQWKENYDFNLDSKFTSDPKDKAIIRALHGPWDFSIQDTAEEVRLIVHMWIGLFYSRSTARFFHDDSNLTHPCSEVRDSFEMSSRVVSAPAQSELKAKSVTHTSDPSISKALDLSKKDDSVLDQGSVILDLSLKNFNAEIVTSDQQVNREETSVSGVWRDAHETLNTLKSSVGLQEASTSQCCKIERSTEMINELNDVKSTHENKWTSTSLQKAGRLVHTDVPSFRGDGTFISVQEETKSASVQPGNHQTASGVGHVLHECNNEKTVMKNGIENSEATDMTLVQKHGRDSPKSVTDEAVDSNKEADDVVHTLEPDEIESKDGENWEVKEKPYQEGNTELSPKMTHTGDDSTNEDSGLACNGNLSGNETQLSREETKAVSPGKAENVNEDVDCCTSHDSTNKVSGIVYNENPSENETQLCREETKAVSSGKAENVNEDVDCCTSHDSTNEESSMVCNGNLLENEKQLSREETKADSLGKAENVDEDVDCCTGHESQVFKDDHFEKEDELGEKDSCVSAVEADGDLRDQPLPMMCDGPDSVKKDCIMERNRQAPLEEQPPQADNEEDVCHDLQLRELCANGSALTDEHAISEKAPFAPSEMEPIHNEPAVEDNSENDICLADKAHYQKAALPMSYGSTCSSDGSIPQTNDSVETGSQNKVMANFNPSSDDHEDQDTKSTEGEQKVDNTTQKELFNHQPHSPQCEAIKSCEAEVALNKETDLKSNKTNEGLEKIHSGVVIPFIGIDTSGEDTVQLHDPHSQGNVEEVVQGCKEIPFISETTCTETLLPTEEYSTSQIYSKKAKLSAGKISLSLLDVNKTNQPEVLGSESDDQCPTPTMDEKPFEYLTRSGPSSSISAFSGSDKDKMLLERKLGHKSTVNSDPYPHRGLHPDLELRTLRVLQSIDEFLSKSSHTDESSQIETADMKHSLGQTCNPSVKYIPTCLASSRTSADFKDKKMSNTKPAVVSASTSQELHTESSGRFLISPFSKLEEVLGVRLQLKKTDSSVQHYFERTDKLQGISLGQDCHPHRSFLSTECLQAIKPNIDQDRHKTSQTNLSNEPRSSSQRPVMAVKPSKSDEIQTDCISKDRGIENCLSFFSKNEPTKTPIVTCTTSASMLLEKKTERLRGNSEGLNDHKQEASELSSKSSWLSNVGDSDSKAKFARLDPLCRYEAMDISKFNKIPSSSLPVQSFESAKTSSKLVDGNQGFLSNSFVEKVGQTTKESIEIDQKNYSDASTSVVDYKDDGIIDDRLYLGPQSSLTCTVYNTNQTRSDSFIEQLSQRWLQDDLTQVSMERECLIFSEKMKQLLKRCRRGPICQPEAHDKLNLSCSSPVTVHFSSLEEQEDSVDHLDAPSLVGQKIKVDMSDRKDLADTTEEERTLQPQKFGNPMEHAGVSGVTAECARLYTGMMNDLCAKVPSRPKHLIMDIGYPKTEPSNHFDFCDQMKREMDESFRSNLNSVVKKSCKTKYRFYILMTSEDAFFEETKAQLEAEGHTAVQPSEFFLGEDSSSLLLIILRNEDIAEHICEVPHLLELKKSPGVQFAGIDEPDDVVNLTHQELFIRGGFIMFNRAALESLSVCNMKKMTEILQELRRTGKWKWMLHYRDSRRLKENARLSAEAKEKKHFLNWCQEAGLLEVLPYHECDLTSRDQPDYLTCLVRLQVQNISARYPVFITDTTTDGAFGRNGILTMTFDSFLTCSPGETFTV